MNRALAVDLFAEDHAHEAFISALIERIAQTEGRAVSVRVRSARGGHGRALAELVLYQRAMFRGVAGMSVPDMLVVVIDANCSSFARARKAIEEKIDNALKDKAVIACPDPHIERWYLADPESFAQVVGVAPKLGKRKCERDLYKGILASTVLRAGHVPTLGGIEFAAELVEAMNLYRAGKMEKSLKHLTDDLLNRLKSVEGAS